MVEVDAPSLAELERHFEVFPFSKAAGNKDERIDEAAVLRHMREVRPEVAVIELEPFTAEVVRASLPELKFIACARATPTNIDIATCDAAGVMVTSAPGRNAQAVVEMTLAFVLCLARFIPQVHHELKCRRMTLPPGTPRDQKDILWQHTLLKQNPYVLYRGIEIDGRVLGLIGFGIIGRMITPKAKALGMRVLAHDPFVTAGDMAAVGAEKIDLDGLLAASDFVSMHAKPTSETRGMMNWERFNRMRRDAYFINTARGALVDQDALVRALSEGVIAGAALDVYDQEPQYEDSPLFGLDNLVMTPHIGGATKDVYRHQSRLIMQNVSAYLEGRRPPNLAGKGI